MAWWEHWLLVIGEQLGGGPIVGSAVIMLAALVLAWLVDLFTDRVLLVFTRRTRFHLDEAIIEVLHRPIWASIVLGGAMAAVRYSAPPPSFGFVFGGILQTVLLIIWAVAGSRILQRIGDDWVDHWRRAGRPGSEIVRLGENVFRVLILAGALFLFLSIWKVNITPLLASAGIAGVAIALAAKETLANFFGGVSVFLDQPFRIGDYIILDSGERGEVVEIGLRSTRIMTRDDVQISIPNAIIANTKIINESAPQPRFRVRLKVGVAYGSDLDQVESTLLQVAAASEYVVKEPAPRVRFRNFGDSSLDFELLCWVHDPREKGVAVHQLNRGIYQAFQEKGIVIPFPQRDVHLYPAEDFAARAGSSDKD